MNAIRIATWNLGRPTVSQIAIREGLTSWLRKVNADVWVLTETHSAITPGEDFHVVATPSSDPAEPGQCWTAIWSRFPMTVSHDNRAALSRVLNECKLTCLTGGADDPVRLDGARAHATIGHICVSPRLALQTRWPRFAFPLGHIPTKTLSDHFGTGADFHDA